ncbi:fatty acyl-CoA reductase wat-like [Condylostylus longicornis]|uniref:fatty acyl-CoA reductase wat-like n=1 Tax=Condylostylus longicornis TaxID=2530218 RepID=UPI00244E1242|nr:fatty acyl-CoA reductase wat-like [Condylostylus longicornis]
MDMYDFSGDGMKKDENLVKHSQIKDYFKGKSVLLTGGLGFLGQLYVEKLLRSDVKEIFLVARDKKGKTAEQRCLEEFSGTHFCKLKAHDPNFFKRIRIVLGDIKLENIGISDNDLKDIYENVNIVLHAAADVRFDEKLVNLILTNLRGTRELLKISEKIKNLEVFAYISTGYSNCNRKVIEEKFYEPPVDSEGIITFFEKLNQIELDEIERLTDIIIKPWPNTYVFSKCLSEDLVRRYGKKFPTIVIRPTIVISTHEDPVPGWCNNIYGLNGVLVACGTGVLRVMPFDRNLIGDVVCADHVTNSTLAAMWYTDLKQKELNQKSIKNNIKEILNPEVYYVGTSVEKPTTWREIAEATNRECTKNPPASAMWKQCENDTVCPFLFFYYSILFHFIPAIFIDIYLTLAKKKLRFMPIYRKVQKFMIALKFFMQTEFKFTNNNIKKVIDSMTPDDEEFYPSDIRKYDWQHFSYNYVLGLRRYIGREDPLDTNSYKKYNRFVYLHTIFLAIFYGFHFTILWFFVKRFDLINCMYKLLF